MPILGSPREFEGVSRHLVDAASVARSVHMLASPLVHR
jgi:hypothetical protein